MLENNKREYNWGCSSQGALKCGLSSLGKELHPQNSNNKVQTSYSVSSHISINLVNHFNHSFTDRIN